jgi:hypothetical protein
MIKSVELKRDVPFGDFTGEFFAFLFYPVGLWFVQPRLNKIFENDMTLDPDAPLDQHISIDK